MNNVFIMSANRSAIGSFGGTLKNFSPVDLGTLVAKDAKKVNHMIFCSNSEKENVNKIS